MTNFIEHRTKPRKITKKIVVLYHANCTDGFAAAWAAFRTLGKKAEYVSVTHQVVPEGLQKKTIYLLDLVYSRPIMEQLIRDNERVTAIDHHSSVQAQIELTKDYRYAPDKCGSHLAWEYFHPNEPLPFLISVVESFDLNKDEPDMRMMFDWLNMFPFNFQAYTKLARTLGSEVGKKRALKQGALIRTFRERCIEGLIANTSYEVQFGEHRVRAVNNEMFHHEVATALAQGRPFGLVWRVIPNGVYVSLRSMSDGVDVGALAARYGGGGHAHASGFTVATVGDLPFKQIDHE